MILTKTLGSGAPIDWVDPRVALILIEFPDIRYANTVPDKIDMLAYAITLHTPTLLAAWPGQLRQDIFTVPFSSLRRINWTLHEELRKAGAPR